MFYGITIHNVRTTFAGQTPAHLSPAKKRNESRTRKSPRNFPQVMSSPQLWEMNRYKANHAPHKQQDRRPE